jgi:hypothetical protein
LAALCVDGRDRCRSTPVTLIEEEHTVRWRLQQGRGFISRGIGWFGGGYSHIDVYTPKGFLRGARSDVLCGVPAGYQDRPDNYDKNISQYTIFSLPVSPAQEAMYWEFSDRQLGKPYDKRGIAGFALGYRDWRSPDSWYCSEEVQANAEYGGIFRPLPAELWRVDPADNAFQLCALGASWQTTRL